MIRFILKLDDKYITIDEDTPKLLKAKSSAKGSFEVVGCEFLEDIKPKKEARSKPNHELPLVYDGTLSVDLLGLYTRQINVLKKMGYSTLQDIADANEADFINLDGFGWLGYERLTQVLKESGLNFFKKLVKRPSCLYEYNRLRQGYSI